MVQALWKCFHVYHLTWSGHCRCYHHLTLLESMAGVEWGWGLLTLRLVRALSILPSGSCLWASATSLNQGCRPNILRICPLWNSVFLIVPWLYEVMGRHVNYNPKLSKHDFPMGFRTMQDIIQWSQLSTWETLEVTKLIEPWKDAWNLCF